MRHSLLLVGGLVAGVLGTPFEARVRHESRDISHPSWTKREPLDANSNVPVRIAMKQRNLEHGMDYLMEVSDPRSLSYGKHLTQDEIVERFAPSDEAIVTVKKWLVEAGIPERSINVPRSKAWVEFKTRARQLETMLQTRYHVYDHVEARDEHIGADHYDLPRDVSNVVDFISPGVVFATRRSAVNAKRDSVKGHIVQKRPIPEQLIEALRAAPDATSTCGTTITPACVMAMYNISAPSTIVSSSNNLGIFEDADTFVQSDLNTYFKDFSSVPSGTAPIINRIDGATGSAKTDPEGEADLDFEIAYPLIYPQLIQLFVVNTGDTEDLFDTFLDAVDGSYCTFSDDGITGDDTAVDGTTKSEQCGAYEITNVISISYGTAESNYPANYLERQCDEFMKLGLQGVTVVMASGDDGVATRSGPCLGSKKNIFVPDTGASCPYITTVGATVLPSGSVPGDEETAVVEFSSGGGFSNIFTTPSYQSAAVSNYLDNHNPGYASYNTSGGVIPTTGGIYNQGGRGYPDMAAVGDNAVFIINGEQQVGGGTSMSSPIVASIFNRINEARIAAGKSVIGFVNPTLYQHPEMFHDITVGNQAKGGPESDNQASACGNTGFSCAAGWDPVTGLGTPNYPEMLSVFMSL